jgi:hypothetical protein
LSTICTQSRVSVIANTGDLREASSSSTVRCRRPRLGKVVEELGVAGLVVLGGLEGRGEPFGECGQAHDGALLARSC